MLVLMGKTASGKDTIAKQLITNHGFSRIVTYTTRPKRRGEKDGVTYHFVTQEEFEQKVNGNFFAEWKSYNTEHGTWYYGTSYDDIVNADDKTLIILTPDGYRDIIEVVDSENLITIYLYANNKTIQKRLVERGDDPKEAKRRIEHDNADFKGLVYKVDRIVYNNIENKIDDVIDKILKVLEVSDEK